MAHVVAVFSLARHGFAKQNQAFIELLAGQGVRGDAHCGKTVQHLFDARRNASRPNIRQVHLIEAELFAELGSLGFDVAPGELGENVVVSGVTLKRGGIRPNEKIRLEKPSGENRPLRLV